MEKSEAEIKEFLNARTNENEFRELLRDAVTWNNDGEYRGALLCMLTLHLMFPKSFFANKKNIDICVGLLCTIVWNIIGTDIDRIGISVWHSDTKEASKINELSKIARKSFKAGNYESVISALEEQTPILKKLGKSHCDNYCILGLSYIRYAQIKGELKYIVDGLFYLGECHELDEKYNFMEFSLITVCEPEKQ